MVGILFSGGTLTRSDLRGFVPRGNHQILGRVVAPPPGSQQVRVAKGVQVIGRETRGGRRVRRPVLPLLTKHDVILIAGVWEN